MTITMDCRHVALLTMSPYKRTAQPMSYRSTLQTTAADLSWITSYFILPIAVTLAGEQCDASQDQYLFYGIAPHQLSTVAFGYW